VEASTSRVEPSTDLAESRQAAAHTWLSDNWLIVRSVAFSRNKQFMRVPNPTDTKQFAKCLRAFLVATTGMGIEKLQRSKSNRTHRLTLVSFWTSLGIDTENYIKWWVGKKSAKFGMCPVLTTQCDLCDTDGPEVRCIRQEGLWRCVDTSYPDHTSHREFNCPIDVGYQQHFIDIVQKRSTKLHTSSTSSVEIQIMPTD
jgi:hypothetical protein